MFNDVLLLQESLAWDTRWLGYFICVAVIYAFLLGRLTNIKFYHKQPLLFLLGLGLLYLTIGSPLTSISHLSFSLHMIQMSILYFIIPPLILFGIPARMLNQVFAMSKLKRLGLLLSPKRSLHVFAVLFLIYHLPFVLNILSQYAYLQNGYLLLLFILSFGMWWPFAAPDVKQRFERKRMKRYAFRSGLMLMPACMLFIITALIDSGNNPFLSQITAELCMPASQTGSFNLLPPPFNTKYDQLMAGIFMLGLHKVGLVLTFKLGNKVPVTAKKNKPVQTLSAHS